MKIAFVTPELNALVRRTSLAEVSESLPRTLRQEGGDVRVFLPFTADVNASALQDLKQVGEVVKARCGIRMVGAELLLADRQRALVERTRSDKIPLRLKHTGEIV